MNQSQWEGTCLCCTILNYTEMCHSSCWKDPLGPAWFLADVPKEGAPALALHYVVLTNDPLITPVPDCDLEATPLTPQGSCIAALRDANTLQPVCQEMQRL